MRDVVSELEKAEQVFPGINLNDFKKFEKLERVIDLKKIISIGTFGPSYTSKKYRNVFIKRFKGKKVKEETQAWAELYDTASEVLNSLSTTLSLKIRILPLLHTGVNYHIRQYFKEGIRLGALKKSNSDFDTAQILKTRIMSAVDNLKGSPREQFAAKKLKESLITNYGGIYWSPYDEKIVIGSLKIKRDDIKLWRDIPIQ